MISVHGPDRESARSSDCMLTSTLTRRTCSRPGQVEVRGADHLHAVHVHQLVIQDIAGEQDLAGAPDVIAQV
jgi:hypothetical protein